MWNSLHALQDDFDAYNGYGKFSANFQTQYENITKQMLDEFQKEEEQRIQIIKDSLQKLLIYEVSVEQNHKYDVKQINDIIEAINPESDIQDVISKELSGVDETPHKDSLMKLLQLEQPYKSGWDKLFEVYREKYRSNEESMDYSQTVEETKYHIMRCDDKDYKAHSALFQQITQKLLINFELPDSSMLERAKQSLNTRKGRWAFIDSLNECVKSKSTKLTQEGYKAAAHLALQFLDYVTIRFV